jgi:hypothetical protein
MVSVDKILRKENSLNAALWAPSKKAGRKSAATPEKKKSGP